MCLCVTSAALGLLTHEERALAAPPAQAALARAAGMAGAADDGDIEEVVQSTAIPQLSAPPSLNGLSGRPITRVEVVTLGGRWATPLRVASVRVGEALSIEAGRRAMREMLATGNFARAMVDAFPDGDGAALRVSVLPRRIIATIQMNGSALDPTRSLEAAGVTDGGELTAPMLAEVAGKIRAFYARHGFPSAAVAVDASDTDDPIRVVLSIQIKAGPPRIIAGRVFVIDPRADREVGDLKQQYALGAGARVDEEVLAQADRDLADALRQGGFHRAEVNHAVQDVSGQSYLYVYLTPGPRIVPAFDGNHAFDDDQLTAALGLRTNTETRAQDLADRLKDFYVARGFYDVEVSAAEVGKPDEPVHHLMFTVRENKQVRVTHRVFPCLSAGKDPDQIGKEIESFLAEDLPGNETFSAGNPQAILSLFGPTQGAGGRARPLELIPAMTYVPDTYDRALKHLRDLFHSEGYLNAVVGPVSMVRATCGKGSTGSTCVPEPLTERAVARCQKDALGLPVPEPPVPDALTCRPDPARHVECAPNVTLRIPIHLGPQTTLYDLAFEGNRTLTDKRLAEIAELKLGGPLSNVDLEAARLRVSDEYKNRGYAYVEVHAVIEPSPDRTRARARFIVTERDRVTVTGFVVRGNTYTDEGLILRRVALRQGAPYRQSWVRLSEERIATLGTFSSVSVGLEDPDVPQKNKRVVVTVAEQLPQYLDPRIGFSTGEGLRFAFEYGHRNIAGLAIALTLRVQLSYLFEFIILDPQVRKNYDLLPVGGRLERRNTASITFPEIGLGPLVSLSVDGIDVRDNQRDFGLTKQAVIPTFTYRPRRQVTARLGATAELNDVQIFACARTVEACNQQLDENKKGVEEEIEELLLAPKGRTLAFAQQASVAWDARDNQFAATRGFAIAGGVEHVNAFPSDVFGNRAVIKSHFLRLTGKVSGYVRLSDRGAALAMSLAGGYNLQLNDTSQTYPDRLFFMGGVDTMRAFLANSMIPEDVAQKLLSREIENVRDVRIRGGDLSLNPRIELRLPINDTFHTGVFLDTGNLWVKASDVDFTALRYAGGAGLRITTPIGPLALDYGINLLRRSWEDFGAFHFSIGLF
jgi:outer membrane protein assembly factor BamA